MRWRLNWSRPSRSIRRGCAMMVQEAGLGERIMRALILRRVALLEQKVGPVIVGRADNRDVLRLQGFLSRNGYPYQVIDPIDDGKPLEQFHVVRRPTSRSSSASMARVLRNPTETPAGALHRPASSDRSQNGASTWRSSARGLPVSPPPCMPPPKGFR